jgi:hypothetical protein
MNIFDTNKIPHLFNATIFIFHLLYIFAIFGNINDIDEEKFNNW